MVNGLLVILVHLENIQMLLLKYHTNIVAFCQKLISKTFLRSAQLLNYVNNHHCPVKLT